MALIVQKFGGTSVADLDRIRNVANVSGLVEFPTVILAFQSFALTTFVVGQLREPMRANVQEGVDFIILADTGIRMDRYPVVHPMTGAHIIWTGLSV